MTDATRVSLESGGKSLSALRAPVSSPRGLVLALHGGSHDAQYWHHPSAPDASLLVLGQKLGFDVVALDRPGHGGSLDAFPDGATMEEQVEIIHDLARSLGSKRGLPVFLIGHSLGAVLSILAADSARGDHVAGIDVAGAPVRFTEEQDQWIRAMVAEAKRIGDARGSASGPNMLRAMFFGNDGSFDPAVLTHDPVDHRPMMKEIAQVVEFPSWAKQAIQAITAPVQWTFAAQEVSSLLTPDLPGEVQSWLSGSRDARIFVQQDSGHNISLHHVGRAYHLRALAFFEDVAARRPRNA